MVCPFQYSSSYSSSFSYLLEVDLTSLLAGVFQELITFFLLLLCIFINCHVCVLAIVCSYSSLFYLDLSIPCVSPSFCL